MAIGLGAVRAWGDLRTDGIYITVFVVALMVAIALHPVLHAVMDSRMAPTTPR